MRSCSKRTAFTRNYITASLRIKIYRQCFIGVEGMKKPLALALSVLIALLLCGCTYNDCETVSDMRFLYGTYLFFGNYNPDGAAVSYYTWDGDPEKTDIVIPEKYGKQKIKCLGGYFGRGLPSPFFIDCSSYLGIKSDVDETVGSLTGSMDPSMIEPGTKVVYTDFTIHLSKYIEKIYARADATVYTVRGEKTAYCPRVSIICDEDNTTFYSKDGKLYYRQDDTLVDGFLYAENQ